jgi:hypothetical protein
MSLGIARRRTQVDWGIFARALARFVAQFIGIHAI